MIKISTGILTALAASLRRGDDNVISQHVQRRLEGTGRRFISDIIQMTPLGAGLALAGRAQSFLESGGESEFGLTMPSLPSAPAFVKRFARSLQVEAGKYDRRGGRGRQPPTWRTMGYESRKQWLDDRWRRDWRSQPRNRIGWWIPGRLDYPVAMFSRRQIRIKRIRKESRAMGRAWGKQMFAPKPKQLVVQGNRLPLKRTSSWGRA